MLPRDRPFVLLDDARPGGRQRLFDTVRDIVRADRAEEVGSGLGRLRAALSAGRFAAGYLSYEAGAAFEPRLTDVLPQPACPAMWWGLFDRPVALDPDAFAAALPDAEGAWAGRPRPRIDEAGHAAMLAEIKALIAAGDIYQANLSFRAEVPVAGDPLALYARLRRAAGAGWGAIVMDGERWLLSFSPEMFFTIDGRRIAARPMKGTGPRGRTPMEDDALAAALASDPKQRAENLMIVDLLRNDLSRVARPGSVRVPELFAVERYPTVQQMVSQVEAELRPDCDAVEAIRALFPCGSITGAPKLRAMEAIAAVERDARGPYTGAIGMLAPDGSAAFGVAIRTLVLEAGAPVAILGLGSGIVADSEPRPEWEECLAKGAFVTAGQPPFDLLETMRFDPDDGIWELERHLARLKASAEALGFTLDRHGLRNELHAASFRRTTAARVRLRLAPSGQVAIELADMPPEPAMPVRVAIRPLPVDPADVRLRHKTSSRAFYDRARAESGAWEVVFRHPDGRLTEGSFTNLFVPRGAGVLVTPPLAQGLQPGVLRAVLLDEGRAVEGDLREEDLDRGFLVGNALRGLVPARLA